MSTLADIRTRDALLGQETIAAATAPAEADRRTLLGVVDRLTARIEEFTSINMAAWRTEADAAELQRQLDALRAQLEVVTRQRDGLPPLQVLGDPAVAGAVRVHRTVVRLDGARGLQRRMQHRARHPGRRCRVEVGNAAGHAVSGRGALAVGRGREASTTPTP